MSENNFCQLWLTCADKKEADKIANTLLVKHLVACVRQMPVSSDFWWKGEAEYSGAESFEASAKEDKIEHTKEVLLLMESREDLFGQVEAKVAKLHSYNTFVLEATPISKISKKAAAWLKRELKMPERDFDGEFKNIVATYAAAHDRTLRYFYWDVIHGRAQPLPEARGLIEDEVCHAHNLTADQYRQTLGMCIADIVDVKTGKEMFGHGS